MKKITNIIFVAAAIAALGSCTKNENPVTSSVKVDFTANIQTKTAFAAPQGNDYPTLWTENDKTVKVAVNEVAAVDAPLTVSPDYTSASFSAEFAVAEAQTYVFAAYSPASAVVSATGTTVDWALPSVQHPTEGSVDEAAQLLAAYYTTNNLPENIAFNFSHVTAYGVVNIANLPVATSEITSVVITFPSKKSVKIDPSNLSDRASNLWFACEPEETQGKSLDVTVNTAAGSYVRTIESFPGDFTAGNINKFGVNMATAVAGGLENILVGTWKLKDYGSRASDDPTGQYAWVCTKKGFALPSSSVDGDTITFGEDGSLTIYQGTDGKSYFEHAETSYGLDVNGTEKWSVERSGDNVVVYLGGNIVPLICGSWNQVNHAYSDMTAYTLFKYSDTELVLEFNRGTSYFQAYLERVDAAVQQTYAHSFAQGDFGLFLNGSEEYATPAPLVDGNVTVKMDVDTESMYFYWHGWGMRAGTWGQGTKGITFTIDGISGKVSSVALTAWISDESAETVKMSATVGGNTFGAVKQLPKEGVKTIITDVNGGQGQIKIFLSSVTNSTAYFLKDIEIVYAE